MEICNANEFHYDRNGNFQFDEDNLFYAHHQCLQRFWAAIDRGVNVIILDNTNLAERDLHMYEQECEKIQASMLCINFKCEDIRDAYELAARSTHAIPEEVTERQYELFSNNPPPLRAWMISTEYRGDFRLIR